MALNSMTGFARAGGGAGALSWHWELKSVNGKALDIRFRLPAGHDHLEAPARAALAAAFRRGNIQAALTVTGEGSGETVTLNEAVLEQVLAVADTLRHRLKAKPPRLEALMALRGVLEVKTETPDEATLQSRSAAMLSTLHAAITALAAARAAEGARLSGIIDGQLARIEELAAAARDAPARTPEAIRARLAEQVARLMEMNGSFDDQRLHQEAMLIFTRADIQEELDRLFTHVAAARDLMQADEPSGRKFDFLAQEFNREANTLCSKAIDRGLTAIGLDLKTVIDQMREQVQNIE